MKIVFAEDGYVSGYADDGFDIEGGVEFDKNEPTATFNAENCRFYHMVDGRLLMDVKLKNENNTYFENIQRIEELKGFLVETDFQAIKFAEGAMTEEEFAPIRLQRQQWRDEIKQLTATT